MGCCARGSGWPTSAATSSRPSGPGAAKGFWSVDSPIALAVRRRYPTPLDAAGWESSARRRSSNATATQAARQPRSCSPGLRNGAEGRAGELEMAARREIVPALVSALEPIVARIELTIKIRPGARDAPRRADVPLGAHRRRFVAMRRDDDRRDRRPPRALPHLPHAGRRRRPRPRRRRPGQVQTRAVPMGARPPTTHKRAAPSPTQSRRHNPRTADIDNPARARDASHTHPTRTLDRARSQIISRL